MICTPKTYCPLCGGPLSVIAPLRSTQYSDEVTYICMCGCGKSRMNVRHGKIQSVSLCEPQNHPDFRVIAGAIR